MILWKKNEKGCHPNEFWIKYFTSSCEVRNFRKIHGEPDIIEIRKTFYGKNKTTNCTKHETIVLRRIQAVRKLNWLNKGNGGIVFDTSGKVVAKDTVTGKTILINSNEFEASNKFVGINAGLTHKKNNCCYCNKKIGINTIKEHQVYCHLNPNKIKHPRTGIPLTNEIKTKLKISCANVSGTKNPMAKQWKLASPQGLEIFINGNLDKILKEQQLSRFYLLTYLGNKVPKPSNIRTETSRRTISWKLEQIATAYKIV